VPSTYSVCLGNIERSTGLIDNHLGNLVSVDFFVVPTVLFQV
jgi:hypothetical protein